MSETVKYIPDGYHSVTPYLYIDGAAAAIRSPNASARSRRFACPAPTAGSAMPKSR